MKTNFKNISFYFLIVINISNCIFAQTSKNIIKEGKVITFSNGFKYITNYKNGKKNGESSEYISNVLFEKGNYVNGEKMGEWVRYDEGKVYKNTYKKGDGNYDEIVYDSHGNIFSKGSYLNNKKDGGFIEPEKYEGGYEIYNSENRILGHQKKKKYVSKGFYIKGQKQGIWIDYYENGTLRGKISFIDGVRDGKENNEYFDVAYSFSMDCHSYRNRMIATDILKDTLHANRKENNNSLEVYKKKEGKWQFNYDNGFKLIVNYVGGIKSGDWIGYNENDLIIEKGNYSNGKLNGDWIYYDDSGTIMLEKGHFLNGIPDGEWLEIDDNQKNIFTKDDAKFIQYKGSYINGTKEGKWETLITKSEDFQNANKPINLTFENNIYKNGCRDGEIVTYFEDGSIGKGLYINGIKQGEWIKCFKDGSIRKGLFENGHKQGEWITKLRDGKLVSKCKYINGILDFKSYISFDYKDDGIITSKSIFIERNIMLTTYYNEKGEVTNQERQMLSTD
jgi:antitoxin component YwqK of YwqJK toxin-antitoxin module